VLQFVDLSRFTERREEKKRGVLKEEEERQPTSHTLFYIQPQYIASGGGAM
jgi:hypothetical protein